ncbi:MAG: hypothetical protein ACE5R4_07545 [Armatimonadota bacterium]
MKRQWVLVIALGLGAVSPPRASADQLQSALDALTALHVFNTLELDEGQMRQCLALTDSIQRMRADLERKQSETLAPAWRALADKRHLAVRGLRTSMELDEAVSKVLAEHDYNQQVHEQALTRLLLTLQDILHGQQNALIDWGEPAEEEEELAAGEDEALRYSLHIYALQTIDRARSLGGQYQARRIEVADDYLSAVAPPGTPLYDELLPYVLDVFRRARLMTWLEWLQYRDVLAAQLTDLVGIGREPPPTTRPFNRELIRQLFESPVTGDVLREMLAVARGG